MNRFAAVASAVLILLCMVSCSAREDESAITALLLDGEPIADFAKDDFEYSVILPSDAVSPPKLSAEYTGNEAPDIKQAHTTEDRAIVNLAGKTYAVNFAKAPVYKKSYLQNTYKLLVSDKKLNVAFLGGSATSGSGAEDYADSWAGITEKWLKDSFKRATIKVNNAAFDGIGSEINAYRAYSALELSKKDAQPDLLFVEFALGDSVSTASPESVKAYTESTVRTVLKFAPSCDIVYVFTADHDPAADSSDRKAAVVEVLSAYGIEYADAASFLRQTIASENGGTYPSESDSEAVLRYLSKDGVPTNAGHSEYAAAIVKYLSARLTEVAPLDPEGYAPHPLPEATVCEAPLSSPNCSDISSFKHLSSIWSANDKYISATSDASLSFTFIGTGAYVWCDVIPDGGVLTFTVDSNPSTKRFVMKGDDIRCTLARIVTDLEYGEHTVTVSSSSYSGSSSTHIYGICIVGDETFSGIANTKD